MLGDGAQISAPHVHASALELCAEALVAKTRADGGMLSGDDSGGGGKAKRRDPSDALRVRVLDIGSGSGVMCVLLARLVTSSLGLRTGEASVLAVEHVDAIVRRSIENIEHHHGDLLTESSGGDGGGSSGGGGGGGSSGGGGGGGGPLSVVCGDARAMAEESHLFGAFDLVHIGCALPKVSRMHACMHGMHISASACCHALAASPSPTKAHRPPTSTDLYRPPPTSAGNLTDPG